MLTNKKKFCHPCVTDAFPGGLNRTEFFDGMFLTEKELRREQTYLRMKRQLTNRALGEGVVWGLRTTWDDRKRRIDLSEGYALDCCGNDLIVECPQSVSETQLIDKRDPIIQQILSGKDNENDPCPKKDLGDNIRKAALMLKYVEIPEDPLPVLEDACATSSAQYAYSSIRETTKLCVVPIPDKKEESPLDDFCEALAKLKQECEELGADCDLFFPENPITEEHLSAKVKISSSENGITDAVELNPHTTVMTDPEPEFLRLHGGVLRLNVTPLPGYIFTGGEVLLDTGESHWLYPFGNTLELKAPSDQGEKLVIRFNNVRLEPLFTDQQSMEVSFVVSGQLSEDKPTVAGFLLDTREINPIADKAKPCRSPFEFIQKIIDQEPGCGLKATAVSLLHGWMRSSLGPFDVDISGDTAGKTHRQIVAWALCRVVWQALFNVNWDSQGISKINLLIQTLFQKWCQGFVYPGPRCCEREHGVYLGCLTLNEKGRILAINPWRLRRHVVTGPLLHHWGSQFGLPRIDSVAANFADWICCVKNQAEITAPDLTQVGEGEPVKSLPLNQEGAELVLSSNLDTHMHHTGLSYDKVEYVSHEDFHKAALEAVLSDAKKVGNTTHRRVLALPGQNSYLLIPSRRAFQITPHGADEKYGKFSSDIILRKSMAVKPLARKTTADFLTVLADDIKLESLRESGNEAHFSLAVDALGAAGIASVREYLEIGPEEAAEKSLIYRPEDINEEEFYVAIEEVFEVSENVIEKASKPLLSAIEKSETPFVRTKLNEEKLITEVRKSAASSLKNNRLTKAKITDVAATTIAMGPASKRQGTLNL